MLCLLSVYVYVSGKLILEVNDSITRGIDSSKKLEIFVNSSSSLLSSSCK